MGTPLSVTASVAAPTPLGDLVGSYWRDRFDGAPAVLALLRAAFDETLDLREDLAGFEADVAVPSLTYTRRLRGRRVTLRATEKEQPVSTPGLTRFPLSDVVGASWLTDRPVGGTVALAGGVDFSATGGYLTLKFDPFTSAAFEATPVMTPAGVETDQTIDVWLHSVDVTTQNHTRLAKLAGFRLPASAAGVATGVALFNAGAKGPSWAALYAALAAATDAPAAETAGETVDTVSTIDRVVVTDRRVYHYAAAQTPVVEAGDVLSLGQPLTDAYEVIRLWPTPAVATLSSLTIPANMVWLTAGPLGWVNANVPLEVTTVSGRTRVAWSLTGDAADVTAFWDDVFARGIVDGATSLAHVLDTRVPAGVSEPDVTSLPAVINPLGFLGRYVFGRNALVVRYAADKFGADALPLTSIKAAARLAAGTATALIWVEA